MQTLFQCIMQRSTPCIDCSIGAATQTYKLCTSGADGSVANALQTEHCQCAGRACMQPRASIYSTLVDKLQPIETAATAVAAAGTRRQTVWQLQDEALLVSFSDSQSHANSVAVLWQTM